MRSQMNAGACLGNASFLPKDRNEHSEMDRYSDFHVVLGKIKWLLRF